MHPAPSVIVFTTCSGLGFGLLIWLGLGFPAVTGWVAFVFFAIAYLLAVGGLMASTFHLGRPERAMKAFTQWKTSWLSREGWCAVAGLILMAVYGAGLVFLKTAWPIIGLLGALASLATVFTTSMIYTQLKTIPRWHTPLTPAMFLSLSLAGGALLAGQAAIAPWLLILAGAVQIACWIQGDKALAASGTTLATATGLGGNTGDVLISIENLLGSRFNDTLTGDSNDNDLRGHDGDDTLVGGLGEAVASGLLTAGIAPTFRMIGLPDAFLEAGALPTLHDMYGLSVERVAERIRGWL